MSSEASPTTPPVDDTTAPIASQQTTLDHAPDADASPAEDPIEKANSFKAEGTDAFRAGRWTEALVAYEAAVRCLPQRAPAATDAKPGDSESKLPTREDTGDEDEDGVGQGSGSTKEKGKVKEQDGQVKEEVVDVSSPAVSEADKETVRLRAVLNANIGACYVKLGKHKEAAQACSQAILDDPAYVKARERRAASNEIIGTWTSLSSAQEEYTALLQLHTTPSQQAATRRKLQLLKPRLEAAQKRETDEMMGKLKGLGNSILGNFGMSTDNFKFEPNGAGGYSLNFTR